MRLLRLTYWNIELDRRIVITEETYNRDKHIIRIEINDILITQHNYKTTLCSIYK